MAAFAEPGASYAYSVVNGITVTLCRRNATVAALHGIIYASSSSLAMLSGCFGRRTRAMTRRLSGETHSKQHQYCPAENGSLMATGDPQDGFDVVNQRRLVERCHERFDAFLHGPIVPVLVAGPALTRPLAGHVMLSLCRPWLLCAFDVASICSRVGGQVGKKMLTRRRVGFVSVMLGDLRIGEHERDRCGRRTLTRTKSFRQAMVSHQNDRHQLFEACWLVILGARQPWLLRIEKGNRPTGHTT